MTGIETVAAIATLRDEHEVILRALSLLERLGQALEATRPLNRTSLGWLVEFFRTFADRCHHGKEEQHLFPALARHDVPVEGGPVGVMLAEHAEGRQLLGVIGAGTDREVAEAIRGYVALLRAHIDKENTILFPLAEHILDEDERRRLAAGFAAVEETFLGPGVHDGLVRRLARLEAELSPP